MAQQDWGDWGGDQATAGEAAGGAAAGADWGGQGWGEAAGAEDPAKKASDAGTSGEPAPAAAQADAGGAKAGAAGSDSKSDQDTAAPASFVESESKEAAAPAPAVKVESTKVGDYAARLASAKEADEKLGALSALSVREVLGQWSRRLRVHREEFRKQADALGRWEEARRRASAQLMEASRRHAELRREARGMSQQLERVRAAQSDVSKALDGVEEKLQKRSAEYDGAVTAAGAGADDASSRRRYVQRLRAADRRAGELAAAVRALTRRARAERAAAERAAGGGGGLQSVRRALQSHLQRLHAVEKARGSLSARLARVEAALGAQEGAAGRGILAGAR